MDAYEEFSQGELDNEALERLRECQEQGVGYVLTTLAIGSAKESLTLIGNASGEEQITLAWLTITTVLEMYQKRLHKKDGGA